MKSSLRELFNQAWNNRTLLKLLVVLISYYCSGRSITQWFSFLYRILESPKLKKIIHIVTLCQKLPKSIYNKSSSDHNTHDHNKGNIIWYSAYERLRVMRQLGWDNKLLYHVKIKVLPLHIWISSTFLSLLTNKNAFEIFINQQFLPSLALICRMIGTDCVQHLPHLLDHELRCWSSGKAN